MLSLTGDGRHLAEAAEKTVAEGLRELVAGTLAPSAVTAAARSLERLRSALERAEVGMPTG